MTSTAKVISSVIDGREAESTGAEYVSRNPSRLDDVVATVTLGGPTTLADAARSAKRAQREWAAVPAPVRGRVIASFGRLVEANKQTLAELVTREIGKPLPEALGEVQEIIDTADFFIGEGRRLYGQTVPSEMPDKQLFTFRVPVGVAAVITAGNFPVAVPSWYLVPALLCGNAVVWKPAEYASASARALAELAWRAGVPAGVLNLVYADGENTFAGLEQALTEGTVNKIGFTGSSAVGVKVGELAGRHLQSACLELGGKNPMVIAPDADLDLAVEGALFSGFGTAGQRCTSLGTVIVHEDVHDEFVRRLTAALENAVVGDPTSDVLYGPMLDQKFADNYDRMLGWIADHHTVLGSTATGRITDAAPRAGFVGDHSAGLFYHRCCWTESVRMTRSSWRRPSGRWSVSRPTGPSTRPWNWRTGRATACPRACTPAMRRRPSGSGQASAREWSASTTRPPVPRRTCPSAATVAPVTAAGSRASGCWTSSPAGSR